MSDDGKTRCSWRGCCCTSVQPFTDGWAGLAGWGPGIPDGWYCNAHAAALNALEESGELDSAQSKH
jgi:hypothetical protein